MLICFQRLQDFLYVSSSIKSDYSADFLEMTANFNIICNAITALVAPEQYDAGMAATQLIKSGQHLYETHQSIYHWNSVWSGCSVIVNRSTPIHRDAGAAPTDYDFLSSSGTHKRCVLDVYELGARLWYPPGTGVVQLGRIFRHGVRKWDGGERICCALFVKDAVHDRLEQRRPNWVSYNDYICLTLK